jgi:hypothetical protein
VFVYTTPREGTIQVITSTPTWDALVQHPKFGRSSALLATDKLTGIVAKVQPICSSSPGASLRCSSSTSARGR